MPKKINCDLIIPVFNEEEAIPIFIARLDSLFPQDGEILFQLIFIDDGSRDNSLGILLNLQKKDRRIVILELSRNFGKEAALTAGLAHSRGDVAIPVDVDLQDPLELIPEMLKKWREGYDAVLARRASRKDDSFIKRFTASGFYNVINHISNVKIPANVGDYRLLDRAAVDAVNSLPESCRFMKGIFSYIGFRSVEIDYERPGRSAGKSSFGFWKLWNFALDGITSFSTAPLRIWSYLGVAISGISLLVSMFFLWRTIFFGVDVPGYASLIFSVTFLGGLQLLGIGILGEYLGRVFMESKNRPAYFIRHIYKQEDKFDNKD